MEDRFWRKVQKGNPNDCWNWIGAKDKDGYGQFRIRFVGKKHTQWKSHRVSYLLSNKNIRTDLMILHKCDNPSCCNPDHLFAGNSQDNTDDARNKGRILKGEKHPSHKLTDEQVKGIRHKYASGKFTAKQLAVDFSISLATIRAIIYGYIWKHIQ